jgi:hypothetical protein
MSTGSRDLQQRDLDAGGFEVLRIADPTTPNSATKVGTAIAAVGPANAPGTSFKAAAEDHVHAGVAAVLPGDGIAVSPPDVQGRVTVSRAPGGADAVIATLDTEAEKSVTGTDEQLLAEWNFDFDDLAGANIIPTLSAIASADSETTGTFNLRIGGTVGAVDGDVRTALSADSVADAQKTNTGAAFPKPSGQTLVKVTGSDSIAGLSARIRGISAVLRGSS